MKKRQEPKLAGSPQAKRQAAVILEVLSGLRGTQEGAEAMGVALNRYYQLETRALGGMIQALEPRPKGRRRSTPEDRIADLERDKRRLEQEVGRQQSLVRAAHRSLGVPALPKPAKKSKVAGKGTDSDKTTPRRRRSRTRRGVKVVARLRRSSEVVASSAPATKPTPESAEASS
jgi:hypothetical protein